MQTEAVAALARLESLVSWYEKSHSGADLSKEWAAVEVLRRELETLPAIAAIYHEGIESITSRKAHNDWVDSLVEGVEWEPLREFLENLKEPEVGGRCDVRG